MKRVYHQSNVPCEPFYVSVENIEQAILILNVLANYDLYLQDLYLGKEFSNCQGLEQFNEDSQEWEEYYNNDGESIEDLMNN
jgi:hypothetical protein